MRNALVVGGSGFIGQHLVHLLLSRGYRVTVYDRAPRRHHVNAEDVFQYVQGELGNQALLREHLAGIDVVYHLACTTIPKTSNEEPAFDVESNVVPSIGLLAECVQAGVGRVVFVSSGGTVYGIPKDLPVREDHLTMPICSYGITKLMIEHYLALFRHLYGLRYSIIRPSNPYGEGQNYYGQQGAVTVFLGRIAMGQPIEIWGDGSVVRDYFYVGDLAQACLQAAETEIPDLVANVGSGQGLSLRELLTVIRESIGIEFAVHYSEARPFDVPYLVLDIDRARRLLSWEPQVPMTDGIQRTWEWVSRNVHAEDSQP